jgi:hypothetical protein
MMTTELGIDPDAHYTIRGWRGVAWYYVGPESAPTPDTEWDGIEEPTGLVLMCMVGDDRVFPFDPSDLTLLDEADYCSGCGQVGCGH